MFHHFPALDIDLYQKMELDLKLDTHETKFFIHKVKITVLTFPIHYRKFQPSDFRLEGLAILHNKQSTDEAFLLVEDSSRTTSAIYSLGIFAEVR